MQEWWTAPAEAEDGRLIMVSGRNDVEKFRSKPKFSIRIEIDWVYDDSAKAGMPDDETAKIMEQATDNMSNILEKNKVAIMTGIFTGAGVRTWVFYTLSTNLFQNRLNEALASLPLLPLKISAENDPEWLAYEEMKTFEIM